MRLSYEERGSGRPLLILHGLFGSLANWRAVARRLSASRRVISVDLRNHGRSPHVAGHDYAKMAADVAELIASSSLERADLLGHSMGGKVAMSCALRFGTSVRRLVVVDIAPRAYAASDTWVIDALADVDPSGFDSRSELDRALSRRIDDASLRAFLLMNATRGDDGRFHWRFNLDAIMTDRDAIAGAIEADEAFDGPTLLIRGQRSDYVTHADLPLITRLFPRAEVATIASAGHWVHVDAPDRLCELVEAFLGR